MSINRCIENWTPEMGEILHIGSTDSCAQWLCGLDEHESRYGFELPCDTERVLSAWSCWKAFREWQVVRMGHWRNFEGDFLYAIVKTKEVAE